MWYIDYCSLRKWFLPLLMFSVLVRCPPSFWVAYFKMGNLGLLRYGRVRIFGCPNLLQRGENCSAACHGVAFLLGPYHLQKLNTDNKLHSKKNQLQLGPQSDDFWHYIYLVLRVFFPFSCFTEKYESTLELFEMINNLSHFYQKCGSLPLVLTLKRHLQCACVRKW